MGTPMFLTSKPLLASLLGPGAVDEFLTQHWPRRVYVAHGDPLRFPAALRAQELGGVHALSQCYGGTVAFKRGDKSEKMVPIKRTDASILFGMGLTLHFEDVGPYVPGVSEFLRGLERELGINENSMLMSAFASPHEEGLGCHFDAQDVISIQLQGTKRFHYAPVREIAMPYGVQFAAKGHAYDELYAQANNGFPDDKDVKFETAEMRPGTVLFLPRGTWHYTEAGESSLSVSICIRPPTLVDCALEQLRWLLLQDSAWREPLYGATATDASNEKLRAHAARLLEKLPALVSCLSAQDLISTPIPITQRLHEISYRSRFQRAPDAVVEIGPPSPRGLCGVTVRVGRFDSDARIAAQLEIPADLVPVLRWIDERSEVFTGETLQGAFPKLPTDLWKQILATLVQAQFIRIFWFPNLRPEARVGEIESKTAVKA